MEEYFGTIQAIGAIAGTVVAIVAFLAFLYSRWSTRIQIRRITSTKDEDLEDVIRLHVRLFPDERLRIPGQALREAVRELEEERSSRRRSEWETYILKLKRGQAVLGYLDATYNTKSGFLFISYIAIDEEKAGARSIRLRRKLIDAMGRRISLYPYFYFASRSRWRLLKRFASKQSFLRQFLGIWFVDNCRAIIGELDKEEIRDGIPRCEILRCLFQRYAESARLSCYILAGIQYKQPVLDINIVLALKPSEPLPEANALWIVYVPVDEPMEGRRVSRAQLLSILDFIINGVYGEISGRFWHGVFEGKEPEASAYRLYCKRYFDQYVNSLPEFVDARVADRPELLARIRPLRKARSV